MKVSELAAELKKQNKDIIDIAAALGIDARGATKILSETEADKIRHGFDKSAMIAAEEKKARLMPRRIAKADVEEAERAKIEAEAAEEERRIKEEEEAAKAAEKAAPVLKVAKKAEAEPARKKMKREASAETTIANAEEAKPETTGEPAPGMEEGVKTGEDNIGEPGKETEAAPQMPIVDETDSAASEKADEAAPVKAEAETGKGAEGEKRKTKPDHPKGPRDQRNARKGDMSSKPKPGEAAKKPQDNKKPEKKDENKDKDKDNKDKKGGQKEQKPGVADRSKPDDSQGSNSRKKSRNAKKNNRVEEFRGSAKNPIIDDGSLEKEKRKKHRVTRTAISDSETFVEVPEGTFVVNVPITVAGFAEQIERTTSEIILALMKMGVIANINQNLNEETVQLLALELGVPILIGKDEGEIIEEGMDDEEDDEADLVSRPPIITVMGHVDHGKTSLLDAIRNTHVTDKETGGITQHIGASEVQAPSGERIVFLDTPGHEAFTAMRARGAHITDIAVLVVAADDGVMPQTVESISHARAAGVPIIVAINKIDKPGANPDRVKQELADNNVLVEEYGGSVICVPVSAKTGEGIGNLLEMILLQAEVLELQANPGRHAIGTVIEARLDKSKGPLATLLVLNGTLKDRMSIVAGTTSAKIRMMTDFKGKTIRSAGPATAVEITGFAEVPQAGDEFRALDDDKLARDIADRRRIRQREQVMSKIRGNSLENLFSRIREGEIKELKVIIKADVMGSVGAIAASLEKIDVEGVRVNIIHRGVGTVTESDVMLASTSGAVIIGFNVRPSTNVTTLADREGVEIRLYRIIYDVIGEVEAALKGMLDPEYREVILGKVEVRETFRLPNGNQIAGAYVTDGKILRNAEIHLVRDGVVIHEGKIGSLRRFKDDVREVDRGFECGIGIEGYNDIKQNDEIVAFRMEEIERT